MLMSLDAQRTQQQQRTDMILRQHTADRLQSKEQMHIQQPQQEGGEAAVQAPRHGEVIWGEAGGDFESDDEEEGEAARLRRREKLKKRMLASQTVSSMCY
jgi:hypothetical protein